jgi:DNA-binding transcriptional ArsR family regulator
MSMVLLRPINPRRVRSAQRALLSETANELAGRVREVLCEPTRSQIARALGTGPLCVHDIGLAVGRSRTTISKHLRVLLDENFVTTRRRGRLVYYSLTLEVATLAALAALEGLANAAV